MRLITDCVNSIVACLHAYTGRLRLSSDFSDSSGINFCSSDPVSGSGEWVLDTIESGMNS